MLIRLGHDQNRLPLDYDASRCDHLGLFGKTGTGKSTLLDNMVDQFVTLGAGVTLIDPDNDTAEKSLNRCVWRRENGELSPLRFHDIRYHKPSHERLSRIDPFKRPKDMSPSEEMYFLEKRINSVSDVLCWTMQMPDMKDTRRLSRVLTHVLWICAVGEEYHGLSEALRFCTFEGDAWHHNFRKVREKLPTKIATGCMRIAALSKGKRESETESTINLLEAFLGLTVQQMVSRGPNAVDFEEDIRLHRVNLWNLSELSGNQRDAVAGMIFINLYDAAFRVRVPHQLMIEEARRVIGPRLPEMLTGARRRRLNITYCDQGLASLKFTRVDLANEALGQPGTVISFQQTSPWEQDIFAPYFVKSRLNFDLVYKPMDRPDGYQLVVLPEHGTQEGIRIGNSASRGSEDGMSDGQEFRIGASAGESWELGQETGISHEESHALLNSDSTERTDGNDLIKADDGSREVRKSGEMRRSGRQDSNSSSERTSESERETYGRRRTQDQSVSRSQGRMQKATQSQSQNVERSLIRTETHKNHLLPKYRTEIYSAGMKYSESAQTAMVGQMLDRLGVGQFLIRQGSGRTNFGMGIQLPEPFEGRKEWQTYLTQKCLLLMYERHPVFFVPPPVAVWTGKNGGQTFSRSSKKTPRPSSNGSKRDFSPVQALLDAAQQNSPDENGTDSPTSEQSS